MSATFCGRPVAGDRALIMAIVNRTPDSFYDRGATFTDDAAMAAVHRVVAEGADVIDIGGVKAGPGTVVDADEEIRRVVPFIEWVRATYPQQCISVDTWRASVAAQACAAGADVINDTWAGHDPALPEVAAEFGAGLVCSHTGGAVPRTRPFRVNYGSTVTGVVDDVIAEVTAAAERAVAVGVRRDGILIDPTHDFGKNTFHGLALLRHVRDLVDTGWPVLMALSNKFGSIVLTTGNKSEMATGYCTLYGDMAGGFAVIKDLVKTVVFRLARWRNENDPHGTGQQPIPERIIVRPPSAELRPDQTDQDSLPPYEVLDAILERYMENDGSIEDIVAAGYAPADVERVTRLIKINEYKRRQAPIGIRVTHRSFGKDWRYPITSKFRA